MELILRPLDRIPLEAAADWLKNQYESADQNPFLRWIVAGSQYGCDRVQSLELLPELNVRREQESLGHRG
jgi:hypothetical protein